MVIPGVCTVVKPFVGLTVDAEGGPEASACQPFNISFEGI